jgi:hypothetical protein
MMRRVGVSVGSHRFTRDYAGAGLVESSAKIA